jgi:hypothetical protein
MKLRRRTFLHMAAGAAALPTTLRIARAQAYPSRPVAGTPAEFGKLIVAETEKWAEVVKTGNIKAE